MPTSWPVTAECGRSLGADRRAFPPSAHSGPGVMPLWSRSGEEIFYVSQGEMVEARISTVPSFGVRSRELLFPMSPFPRASDFTPHDIALDDQRFVMLQREETPGRELTLVLNSFEELEARVPR